MFGESFQVFGQRVFSGASSSCPGSLHGRTVHVRSSDSEVFELEAEAACLSGRLRKIIATQGLEQEIELPLRKAVLKKVFEYCKHYRARPASDLPTPFLGATLEECGASKWDASFVNTLEQSLLFEVMIVAGFLEIPGLTHLLSAHTCLMVRGKSTDRVRKELGLLSDLSAEEEAHLLSNWRPSTRQTDADEDASADDGRGFGGIAAVMQQLLAAADRTGIVWEDVNGTAIEGEKGEADRLTSKPKSFRQAGWRTAVLDDWRQLGQAPDDIRCDRAIVSAALESSAGAALPLAADSLRGDRHLVLRAVAHDGARLGDASLALRSDEDFVLEACALSGAALAGASAPLRADAAFVKRAILAAAAAGTSGGSGSKRPAGVGGSGIGASSAVLAAATSTLRSSADFVLDCVVASPESLRGASKELREDRAFMLRLAKECGAALRYMEPNFRADAEVVKLAVAQDPQASAYAHVARRGELGVALPWDQPAKARVQVMKQVVQTGPPGFKEPLSVVGHDPDRTEVKEAWARRQKEAAAAGEGGTGTSMRKLRKSVQFSALISLLSNPGQGNYCASNCYLDKLPAYQRPAQIEAVTLMWGPVGSIGMRWKAFGEADVLLAQPDLLLTVNEAAAILRMTVARAEPPEWYGVSLFDEGTRSAVLQLRAGDGTGGGWRPSAGGGGRGREDVALVQQRQRRQGSGGVGQAKAPSGVAARARASGHPSATTTTTTTTTTTAATAASASGGAAERTATRQKDDDDDDDEEVLDAAPKAADSSAAQAARLRNPAATGGTSSSSSSSSRPPAATAHPSKPLSGWPGLAQAESSAPAPIREGSRVQLHGVGSKSGLTGTAIKQTVDGRWKVRLDGERTGNALLRESLLLPLPATADPTPVQRSKPAARN